MGGALLSSLYLMMWHFVPVRSSSVGNVPDSSSIGCKQDKPIWVPGTAPVRERWAVLERALDRQTPGFGGYTKHTFHLLKGTYRGQINLTGGDWRDPTEMDKIHTGYSSTSHQLGHIKAEPFMTYPVQRTMDGQIGAGHKLEWLVYYAPASTPCRDYKWGWKYWGQALLYYLEYKLQAIKSCWLPYMLFHK